MATVGEQLKKAREEQDWSPEQVASLTNIRTDHVRALEEGNYDVFPAPIYVRGFVRNYGSVVKLDVAALLEQLDDELGTSSKFQDEVSQGRRSGPLDFFMLQISKVNWRASAWMLIGLAVVLGGLGSYRAWQSYLNSDPLSELGPGYYQPASDKKRGDHLPVPEPGEGGGVSESVSQ